MSYQDALVDFLHAMELEGIRQREPIAQRRSSGELCIVAFSAKNLPAVARVWADHRPDLRYVICADNDAHLPRNLGVESAVAAAEEIRAEYVVPPELGEAA